MLADIVPAQQQMVAVPPQQAINFNAPPTSSENFVNEDSPDEPISHTQENSLQNLWQKFQDYIETVAMPGIYKLPTLIDFRVVMALFLAVFIVLVTFLSSIPMSQLTKSSIEKESRRRTLTIARSLAQSNHQAVLQEQDSALNTEFGRVGRRRQ